MARYAGKLLAPTEGFGQGFFCPSRTKILIMLLWLILGHFWCLVVPLVTFSSNLNNLEKENN